jgi:hypothetical protein
VNLRHKHAVGAQAVEAQVQTVTADIPLPGFWHQPPKVLPQQTRRRRMLMSLSVAAPVMVVALAAVATDFMAIASGHHLTALDRSMSWVILALANALNVGMAFYNNWVGRKSTLATRKDIALVDDSKQDLLVGVEVLVDGRAVGWDRGVLGFDQGALFFSGHSCSFLLGSQDINDGPPRRLPAGFTLKVDLKHPSRQVALQFNALGGGERTPEYAMQQLKESILAVRQSGPTHLERRYPPLERWRAGEGS